MNHLILGGARSGKSAVAEQLAMATGWPVTYVATARVIDAELAQRVAVHQARRPGHWHTVESPLHLAATLLSHARGEHCLLVDCLTLWLANLLFLDDDQAWPTERRAFLDCLPRLAGHVMLVSNEIGQGVIPLGAGNRRFVDELGLLHQETASRCEDVRLVVAGLSLPLKS